MKVEAYKAGPAKHFDRPESVLAHPGLSAEEKKEILVSWKNELEQLDTATEENMPPLDKHTPQRVSLRQVTLVLERLESLSR